MDFSDEIFFAFVTNCLGPKFTKCTIKFTHSWWKKPLNYY